MERDGVTRRTTYNPIGDPLRSIKAMSYSEVIKVGVPH